MKNFNPKVMAFYHSDGLVPAWKYAAKFSGIDGRIATLPDIIDARLATKPGDVPWETYFTTSSMEFMGRSKAGNRIIIVVHGAPFVTLDRVLEVYSYEYKDKTRVNNGGRISKDDFYALESGRYGNVSIVDLESYVKEYDFPFSEHIPFELAKKDKLLYARLGPRAIEYVEYHAKFAREYHNENNHIEHKVSTDSERLLNRIHIQNPQIIAMHGASNCSYGWQYPISNGTWSGFVSALEKRNAPFAHLLSIGGLANVHLSGNDGPGFPILACDVSCHEWHDGVRLVGIKSNSNVIDIHPGFNSLSRLIRKHWRFLLQPVRNTVSEGFRPLMQLDGEWFTQYVKVGSGMDTHNPEFHINSISLIGEPVEFITEILGYHGFFKYDIKGVRKLAPIGANAYSFVSEVKNIWENGNPEWQKVMVQFYKIKFNTNNRIMHENDLKNDFDTIMSLLEKEVK